MKKETLIILDRLDNISHFRAEAKHEIHDPSGFPRSLSFQTSGRYQ